MIFTHFKLGFILIIICGLISLSGCMGAPPKNVWQQQAISAFNGYKIYYLEDKIGLAQHDLQLARTLTKQGTDLKTLARLELARCAVQIGVLEATRCEDYQILATLHQHAELDAYFRFLQTNTQHQDIALLPSQYRPFATQQLDGMSSDKLEQTISKISSLESRLIAAALMRNQLSADFVRKLIKQTSFHGYKRASLQWMQHLSKITPSTDEANRLQQMILLMKTAS